MPNEIHVINAQQRELKRTLSSLKKTIEDGVRSIDVAVFQVQDSLSDNMSPELLKTASDNVEKFLEQRTTMLDRLQQVKEMESSMDTMDIDILSSIITQLEEAVN